VVVAVAEVKVLITPADILVALRGTKRQLLVRVLHGGALGVPKAQVKAPGVAAPARISLVSRAVLVVALMEARVPVVGCARVQVAHLVLVVAITRVRITLVLVGLLAHDDHVIRLKEGVE
jgi:hypothetical protein